MIDTDKYEGHTPAPWKTNPNDLGTWIDGSSNEEIATVHNYAPANRVNCELIADAPLLLEEVIRLRELLDAIHWDAFAEDDTTLEIDREVAERIRRGD